MPEWLPESGLLKNAGDRAVRAASLIYARGMRLRQYYLLRRAWTAPVPVVSVGNISMGGSGKTPVCAFLLKHLLAWDQRPVLLSRGYKARPPQYPYPVHPLDDPGCCGDEPLMLAQIPGRLRVVVDPSRKRAAGWAVKHLSPTVFVLDDGFQHMHLHRDLDLVLLTVRDLQEDWDRVVPRGRWREGAKALQRADLFLVNTRDKSLDELKSLADGRLRDFKKPVFFFKVEINSLQRLGDNKSTYNIQGRPYLLISAVAGPEKIFASASGFLGYPPEKHLVLPDHHPLGPGTAGKIFHLARKMGVKDVLCTTKDAVKLKPQAGLNFWTMQTGLLFAESREEIFLDVVRHACSGIKKTGTA